MALRSGVQLIHRASALAGRSAGCPDARPRVCPPNVSMGPEAADKAGGVGASGNNRGLATADCAPLVRMASDSPRPVAARRDNREAWCRTRLMLSEC